MSESTSSPTHPSARLLNLMIALVNTNVSMTKQQIRQGVAGYGDAPSAEAFERMFERDKDTLRDLGVPIVTVEGRHAQEMGYRIDMDAYALPPLDLTPAELGVLALAAQFWQDKTLQTDISRALLKLRAAGAGEVADDAAAGLAPRVGVVGDAYGPLLDAISARRVVQFAYRAANTGQVLRREVEPWRLVARGGGWYLLGFDRERRAPRAFRLSRVEGRVKASGRDGQFEVPAHVDVSSVLGERLPGGVARLAVLPERAAALRARGAVVGDDGGRRDLIDVPFESVTQFAEEVVGYADAVVVVSPPQLRGAVVGKLRRAAGLGAVPSVAPVGEGV